MEVIEKALGGGEACQGAERSELDADSAQRVVLFCTARDALARGILHRYPGDDQLLIKQSLLR